MDMDVVLESPGHVRHDTHASMPMYFHFGDDETILFKAWTVSSPIGLIFSCLAVIMLGILYEGIKFFRQELDRKYRKTCTKREEETQLQEKHENTIHTRCQHGVQTLLYMVQTTLSLFIMLIFMTYNVYLCVSVVIGAGLGYLVFGWKHPIIHSCTDGHCS